MNTSTLTPADKLEIAKAAMRDMIEAVGPETAIRALRDEIEVASTKVKMSNNEVFYATCVEDLDEALESIRCAGAEQQAWLDAYAD